jgi:hypothetical protein
MLYEIQNIRQNEGEPIRRWFVDDYFDLVVWMNNDRQIDGFQLCYDKSGEQHALTWHRESGYMHNRVDTGEGKPGKPKEIPILVADGNFQYEEIARVFKEKSENLEQPLADMIYKKIVQYSASGFKKESDNEAVMHTVLDYIEGWYERDTGRVKGSLDTERLNIQISEGSAPVQMSVMSFLKEMDDTSPKETEKDPKKEVVIFDVFQNIASAKLTAQAWTDYLHLTKIGGKWGIVNILRKL